MPQLDGRSGRKCELTETTYLVRFKRPQLGVQSVTANRSEIHGDHLAFLNSKRDLVALFLMEIVESWSEIG
jgi:hypothetical protein